jgi:hypothetical protein
LLEFVSAPPRGRIGSEPRRIARAHEEQEEQQRPCGALGCARMCGTRLQAAAIVLVDGSGSCNSRGRATRGRTLREVEGRPKS